MRILSVLAIILFLLNVAGCSMPIASTRGSLYGFTRVEKRSKGMFKGSKTVTIQDFRQNEAYDEDITDLKQRVDEYILRHPELSESVKKDLREIKVTHGATSDEAILLLGKPDKVMRASGEGRYGATEIWIYRISKLRFFTVFIFPVFPVHEGHYLYFKDGVLVEIEHRSLEQTVKQGQGAGLTESKS
ncbi:MAG: hypothetical protein ABH806_00175 [Candidatus Omnitrophota bacterium]